MKKTATLEKAYIEHVLESGHPPASVTAFCKAVKMEEREFFERFGSLEGLESGIFASMIDRVAAAVNEGEEWEHFSAREKLLAFLYAFSEEALDHRSFLLLRFPKGKEDKHAFGKMRHAFKEFIKPVLHDGRETGELACRGRLNSTYPDVFFGHFVGVVHYHLKDTSEQFSKTDAFIEKTARVAFDLLGQQVVDSAVDLVRFLIGGRGHNPTS